MHIASKSYHDQKHIFFVWKLFLQQMEVEKKQKSCKSIYLPTFFDQELWEQDFDHCMPVNGAIKINEGVIKSACKTRPACRALGCSHYLNFHMAQS